MVADAFNEAAVEDAEIRRPVEAIEKQVAAIFAAWGYGADITRAAATVLAWADLHGIDSHGITMLSHYARRHANGHFVLDPKLSVPVETPSVAVIDAGGTFGHFASIEATRLSIAMARDAGLAAVAVRNSDHFGAAGYYAQMIADAGMVGFVTSSVWNVMIVPTHASEPIFGTNPIAFAAPGRERPSFLLDMATSTVARGKIQRAMLAGEQTIPEGWAVDELGRPVTDAATAWEKRSLTPLGGTPQMSSHKGYGLAAMVEILSVALSGATFAALHADGRDGPGAKDAGHFFLAVDPKAFRPEGGFEDDVDALVDRLHAARRSSPDQPVLAAGDPERIAAADRREHGVPLPHGVHRRIAEIAAECGAPMLL